MTDAQTITIIVTVAGALGTTVWYLIRRGDARLDAERAERLAATRDEREARMAATKEEREARERAILANTEMFLKAFSEQREAHEKTLARLDAARAEDRHDMRDAIASVANKLAAHELYCARELVSHAALRDALQPLLVGQEKIFDRLDTKADKHVRPIGS